ncbi:MAG: hypothetical protein FJ335_05240 [Sphingomonadales bacterium]|nr:hypothetical protein [Sphingomonadales bacterium]
MTDTPPRRRGRPAHPDGTVKLGTNIRTSTDAAYRASGKSVDEIMRLGLGLDKVPADAGEN